MAKETKQQIIDRLQAQNKILLDTCNRYSEEIAMMQERADQEFMKSGLYVQMKREIETLKTKIEILERQNQKNIHKIKNERGAGRKQKLTEEQKTQIWQMYEEGMSMNRISESMKCSVGLIHKVIHKIKNE